MYYYIYNNIYVLLFIIYVYIYLGSKRSFMQVLLKRMAHSLFIIFLHVFSYFLISFILLIYTDIK